MAKGTILFLFILAIMASLLAGFNIGKKFNPNISPILSVSPSPFPSPKPTRTAYTDSTCGFTIEFPGSYINSRNENGQSTIATDPDRPSGTIVTACLQSIPRPPIPPDKIETINIGGVAGLLYHDQSSKDGSPRDEVIVKNPNNNLEIIIAGYGPAFRKTLSSFRFI